MHKRYLTNLFLLVVVAILATAFLLRKDSAPANKTAVVSDIDATNIDVITIQRSDKADIIFHRKQQSWSMISPLTAAANMTRINAILHLLSSKSFAQFTAEESKLEKFQLDPGLLRIKMNSNEFIFGSTEPLNERRYVLFNNTIHLLNDYLFLQLMQPLTFLLSPRLVPETEKIETIQFNNHYLSKLNNRWVLSPANTTIGEKQLQALVDAWQTAESRQVLEYLPEAGEENVVLKFKNGRSVKFDVLSRVPGLVLGRADLKLRYQFDEPGYELLFIDTENREPG